MEFNRNQKIILACTIAVIILMLPSIALAWSLFEPTNKEDCLLKYQKLTKCPLAATLVSQACRCKFETGCTDMPDAVPQKNDTAF